jgi:hypothetical protein
MESGLFPLAPPALGHDHLSQFTEITDDLGNSIPLAAERLYIPSASCLESGASAIRSKIESKPSDYPYKGSCSNGAKNWDVCIED